MRYVFFSLLVLISAVAGVFLVQREFAAGPPIILSAPHAPQVHVGRQTPTPHEWLDTSTVTLSALTSSSAPSGVDVEIKPVGQAFINNPTDANTATQANRSCSTGARCGTGSDPAISVHLPDGQYHWQLRLHNDRGVSPWILSPTIVRVDTTPPTAPQISSPTDPDPSKTYHRSSLRFAWQSTDGGSGVTGYAYRLDTDPHGSAPQDIRTSAQEVALTGLNTGTYYFHVRARDNAGNWGTTATFPVHIDVTPPGLTHVRFSLFQFDPQFNSLRVSFAVTRPTKTIRVGVYGQSDGHLIRLYTLSHVPKGQRTAVWWNGKNSRGAFVPAGSYEIYVRTTDRYGNTAVTGWRDFNVVYQHILVSLSQQRLWAYDGNHLLLTSLVTTGNPALPTPTGTFTILGKFHPFTFHSPWPKSSPFYYPPSPVQYAMLFQDGGYFIHDAPWRTAFGPGTNSQLGTPGSNYTGTHGCINVPPDVAQRLYAWTQIGTVVQVTR